MVELDYEKIIDVYNLCAQFLKEKDQKKFAGRYLELLDGADADLNELLDIARDLDEEELAEHIEEYLGLDRDDEEEDF